MQVFVTGGSGFVGTAIIDELLAKGHGVTALVNRRALPFGQRVKTVSGDLFVPEVLAEGMNGADAVIHVVGIIRERPSRGITFQRIHIQGTQCVVDATRRAGIKRYVQMSALGTRPGAVSQYHKTKFAAEQYVQGSGLDWTIFRPSLIHGARGEFMAMEAKWARRQAPPFLFMPYFGAGAFGKRGAGSLQPVWVKDVARAFVESLEKPSTIGEIYPLAGAQVVTWPQMHQIVAQAVVGKKRAVMALPVWYAKLLTRIVPGALLPFNRDQVIMSQEDNTADMTKFADHIGWTPGRFEDQIRQYANEI